MFVAVSEALTPCETQIDLLLIKNVVFSRVSVKCSTENNYTQIQDSVDCHYTYLTKLEL